jgi:transcriptional antiterminator RfaH
LRPEDRTNRSDLLDSNKYGIDKQTRQVSSLNDYLELYVFEWHGDCGQLREAPAAQIQNDLMIEPEKHWFAVYTKPQKEDYAELNLRLRGIHTFFPKLFLPKSTKRKRQIVPLFPSYLFVRCEAISEEYGDIVWCPGVKRLVNFNGTPAIVDDSIMGFLMAQTGADGVIASRCNVEVGQKISITGGPFDGLVGIIKEPPNARGRVKVLLKLLNRETNVDVPVQFINASWVTQAQPAQS